MAVTTRTNVLLDLEHKFWDAIRRKDGRATKAMTAENCVVVGAQGVSAIDRDTMYEADGRG
jgi:hypothetical protein